MGACDAASALLQWALNRALAADPEVRERLAEVEGARIRIVIPPFPRPLELTVAGTRLVVSRPDETRGEDAKEADLTVSGSAAELADYLMRRDAGASLPPGVGIEGDLALARRLSRLVRRYRFDWEEGLSRYLGDALAHEAARQARAAGRWSQRAAGILSRDLAEYLSEESDMVAGAAALGRFCDAVDDMRDDVDRLQARVSALLGRMEEGRS